MTSDDNTAITSREIVCEVCGSEKYKYTCPKCGVKTCRLACVNIHKKELECDGIRNKTEFKFMQNFDNLDVLNDYRLLEETSRFVYDKRKNPIKRYTSYNRDYPPHRQKLKLAARKRGTVLFFMLDNFTRRKINTTRLHFKEAKIYWHVEWVFVNAHPSSTKFQDERCCEDARLSQLLNKYFDPGNIDLNQNGVLSYYHSTGLNNCRVLLQMERTKGCSKKFHELDVRISLKDNLAGKCIIEYPTLFVIFKDHSYDFTVVDSDDETVNSETCSNVNFEPSESLSQDINPVKSPNKQRESFTAAFARQKRLQIEKEIKATQKNQPKNYLFPGEYSSDEEIVSKA